MKRLLKRSKDIAESEQKGIPNIPTVDITCIKPGELDKDVQPCDLHSEQASQGNISKPLTSGRV